MPQGEAQGHSRLPGRPRAIVRELPFMDPARLYGTFRKRHSILLESSKGPPHLARYSIVAVDPFLELRIKNGRVTLTCRDSTQDRETVPFDIIRELLESVHSDPVQGVPFTGGGIGLFSYDFVHAIERLPCTVTDDLGLPDVHLFFTDSVITVDHVDRATRVSVLPGVRSFLSTGEVLAEGTAAREAEARLDLLCDVLLKAPEPAEPVAGLHEVRIHHEMRREDYCAMVRRAKDYIAAGDIFQANLSQRIRAEVGELDPWTLYLVLRAINPSPFAAYLEMGDYRIASSSPERLVLVSDGVVQTRPIAGTRPRGADTAGDAAMREELILNPKERAEHIMLIDLERNDIGRVCQMGSVEVDELMVMEEYSHVIHIVSNVKGRLVPGTSLADVVRATFPGGTITGVPKVRCMQIIDELEPVARGAYTGSIGYLGWDGRMDLNIVIRTFVIKDGMAYVQAGAGIVADSDPEREYAETLKKAEALIRALERV